VLAMRSFLSVILIFLPTLAYGAVPMFDPSNPDELGSVVASYEPQEDSPSSMSRWKSVRVQATSSGVVTHFLIKIVSTTDITRAPVGFAVYNGTSGYYDPIGSLVARGSYEDYRFGSGAGWYALPFTHPASFQVTAGAYYHLVYLLNPEATASNVARANNADPYPPKWASSCHAEDCAESVPPGVGSETWNFQYGSGSAPWVMGLLSSEGAVTTPWTASTVEDALLCGHSRSGSIIANTIAVLAFPFIIIFFVRIQKWSKEGRGRT